jgi:signal peptidase I
MGSKLVQFYHFPSCQTNRLGLKLGLMATLIIPAKKIKEPKKIILGLLKRISLFFLDIIETGVIALSIFVVVYLFVLQPHEVKGNSMLANFEGGQFLLTDKISYRLNEPERGDVIVFKAPLNARFDYIKRIIGLPGEKIAIKDGVIFIDGQKLKEKYLPEDIFTRSGRVFKDGKTIEIPEDNFIVMGDNRNYSSDSRDWGPVPRKNVVGRVWVRYWPFDSFGKIGKAQYEFGIP